MNVRILDALGTGAPAEVWPVFTLPCRDVDGRHR